MKTDIRNVQIQDIDTLSELATASFVQAYKTTLSEEELLAYSQKAFSPETLSGLVNKDTAIFLVALDQGQIVGYTHLEPLPTPPVIPPGQSAIEIVRLYTKVGYEGRGTGSGLLKQALALCRQAGHDYVWLQVWEGNLRAQHFYQSYGFEALGTQPYCLSRPVVIMGQALDVLSGRIAQ